MIERLQLIASFLQRLQTLLLVLLLLFAGLFAFSLFQYQGDSGSLMLPAIVGFCWALLLIAFARIFAEIPERPGRQHGWLRRLGLRFRRGMMTIMAVLILALSLAVLILSYQLLRTYFMT